MTATNKTTVTGALNAPLAVQIEWPQGAPAESPRAAVVFAHCFSCGKQLKFMRHVSRVLREAGYAFVRFDFSGVGESGGDFSQTCFDTGVSDLAAIADYVAANVSPKLVMMGHSFGGAVTLATAARVKHCVAVVTLAAPFEKGDVARRYARLQAQVDSTGCAEIELGGYRFNIGPKFMADAALGNLSSELKSLARPLLVLHSPADETVDMDNATQLFLHARHPKSFVSLDQADHLLLREQDAIWVGELVAGWASRYR